MTKKDCFAYNSELNECNCLRKLYCLNGDCTYYTHKDNINIQKIERDISAYTSLKALRGETED